MLVKVFGEWINPNNVSFLQAKRASARKLIYWTNICFVGGGDSKDQYIKIENKTPDEVAEEINRLTKGE